MSDEEKATRRGRVKRAVAETAPKIAAALGGPLAGAAIAALSRAIFGKNDASEEAIEAALSTAAPEHLIAIRNAELEFETAMRRALVEEARIDASDRANARARQIEIGDWTPAALGGLIIAGFFIVLAAMVARRLPPGAETEFSIMLGALATMTAAVVNYFFGSSAGSREKTRLLALPSGKRDEN
jgi:hypothetical protein